ncbi:MAG TPA: hypothetical protein VL961_06155 [Acidimicrobiales bacterium]|nr:hypothetical protein [Acidimicrobiales bacterium]
MVETERHDAAPLGPTEHARRGSASGKEGEYQELVDLQGDESFPASDPPSNY